MGKDQSVIIAGAAVVVPQLAVVHFQRARRAADDGLAFFLSESKFAGDLLRSAIDIGADPEVDAGGAGV